MVEPPENQVVLDSCLVILENNHAISLYGFFNEHTLIFERSSGKILGSSRYSRRSSNPPFFVFRKYSTSILLKIIVGSGSLNILLNIEGSKEMGDSPCN